MAVPEAADRADGFAAASMNCPPACMRLETSAPGAMAERSSRAPGGLASGRALTGIPASTTGVGNTPRRGLSEASRRCVHVTPPERPSCGSGRRSQR